MEASNKTYLDKNTKWILLALMIAMIVFPIFGVLDKAPIRLWDESRVAMNAYEMSKSSNWFYTTFEGAPDMWNTKPPLLIWMQALLIKLLGLNPISIRLPSAIAVFFLCIALFLNLGKIAGNYLFGFLVTVVLISSLGFMNEHIARTGDYDALLCLFTTLYCLMFYQFMETNRPRYFYYFVVFANLAVMTKGIAGIMLFPGLLLYTFYKRSFWKLLRARTLYLGIVIFLIPVLFVYIGREIYNPGYIAQVFENEVGGRYVNELEQHGYPFFFYWNNFVDGRWSYWMPFLMASIWLLFIHTNRQIKSIGIFSLMIAIPYFLVISGGSTKLIWYDALLYPWMAILTSSFIFYLFTLIKTQYGIQKRSTLFLMIAFFVSLFFIPYKQVVESVYAGKSFFSVEEDFRISYLLREKMNTHSIPENTKIVSDEYIPHILFYMNMAKEKGMKIERILTDDVQIGDIIIVREPRPKEKLQQRFSLEVVEERDGIFIMKVNPL